MSKERFTKAPYAGQKGRCAWCGTTDLPKRRKSWCSQKCVDEYLMRSSSSGMRAAVYKRDRGICAICGCNATQEYRKWKLARTEVQRLTQRLLQGIVVGWWSIPAGVVNPPTKTELRAFREDLLARYAPGNWTPNRSSGWDADHIVPVVEGGGECSLDNLRTLCHPCHKRVTAELAARRASGRRMLDSIPVQAELPL